MSDLKLRFKIDTGSQAILLPHATYRKLCGPRGVTPRYLVIPSYDEGRIGHMGITTEQIILSGQKSKDDVFVFKQDHQATLLLQLRERLGLVSRTVNAISSNNQVANAFQDLFKGTESV